ncbi:MAG: AfsR/SARP family transcriptional regulator, partial [Acidimicrobiia bacterium]
MERQRAGVLDRVTTSTIEIKVLGTFEVARGDEALDVGGPKQRSVLALLALHGSRGLTVEGLIDGVWGETAPDSARSSVYAYVSNLRSTLGEETIERRRGTYVLADSTSDAVAFEELLDAAEQQVGTEPEAAAAALRDSLDLWRGLPYADLPDVSGLREESRRLEELRVRAVEMLMEAELGAGRGGELVPELRALVSDYPLRERFRAQLMLALYRAGRQAEALRAFDEGRELLVEELGVDPSPELRELQLKILEQDEDLLAGSGQVTTQRLAFLFSDIESSVRLWDLHKQEMATVLAAH